MKQCLTLIWLFLLAATALSAQDLPLTCTGVKHDTLAHSASLVLIDRPAATSPTTISPAFYSHDLGFFCKKEIQVEQKTKLPLRVRLGSLQYTDWLESKSKTPAPLR
jgi:hypothetical protein